LELNDRHNNLTSSVSFAYKYYTFFTMISVPVQDAYIAVIGVKGAGKSSFISSCAEKRPKRGYDAETRK